MGTASHLISKSGAVCIVRVRWGSIWRCKLCPSHFSQSTREMGAPFFLVAPARSNRGQTRPGQKQVPFGRLRAGSHPRFALVRNDKISRNGSERRGFCVADAECAAARYIWAAGQPMAAVPTWVANPETEVFSLTAPIPERKPQPEIRGSPRLLDRAILCGAPASRPPVVLYSWQFAGSAK